LNLIFENVLVKLQEINHEKIQETYWGNAETFDDKTVDSPLEFFKTTEKRHLLSVFADHLDKYLRKTKIHYTNPPVEILKEFIHNNKQNYRRDLSELLN
jgi:hypothetical protein